MYNKLHNDELMKIIDSKPVILDPHCIDRTNDTNRIYKEPYLKELVHNILTKEFYLFHDTEKNLYNLLIVLSKRNGLLVVLKNNSDSILLITFYPLGLKSLKKSMKKYGVDYGSSKI